MISSSLSVLLLDTKMNNPNHYIVLNILAALRANGQVHRVDKATYATAVRMAQTHHYDVFLAVDGEAINIDILSRIKPLVKASVLWAWEDPYERDRTVALAHLFDHIFTNDVGSINAYPDGANHLPLAAGELMPVRDRDADYDYDIAFVGSAWPNRVTFLRRLLRTLPNLHAKIVLSYNPHLPRTYLDLPESSYVGGLSHPDFLDVANRSRINLTLNRDFSGDGVRPKAQSPGPRLFEIALAGGYQLVDTRDTILDSFYRPSRDIDVFRTFDECVQKIDYALKNPKHRIARMRAAQARTLAEHTYGHRLTAIFDKIAECSKRKELRKIPVTSKQHGKYRILFVTHNNVAGGNFGGVEVYQDTIAKKLSINFEIFYYQPAQPLVHDSHHKYVLTDRQHTILQTYYVPSFNIHNTLSQPEAEQAFASVLSNWSINLVHFHHLINHCASLPMIANILGVPTIFTLHDFWVVCTRFNLLDHRGSYCNIVNRPKTACDVCMSATEGHASGAQDYRRSFFSRVLASHNRIISNSPTATAILCGMYPELPDDKIISLGIPVPWMASYAETMSSRSADYTRPLNVVFFGNFTRNKGADILLEAAGVLYNEPITFTICGRIDKPYDDILRHVGLPNVTVEGKFMPGELSLDRFDLSLHLSIWPETYCITLSEAWAAGVVPIVTNCGALADRVIHNHNGYHIPINGSGELIALLRLIKDDRTSINRLRANITDELWLTPQQHCNALTDIYTSLIEAHPTLPRPISPALATGAPTTIALRDETHMPSDWTRPDAIALPALTDTYTNPLAPLAQRLWEVKNALEQGLLEAAPLLSGYLDAIGMPVAAGFAHHTQIWAAPQPPLQVIGWLQEDGSPLADFMLAVRSGSGDLILRPTHLHERFNANRGGVAETISRKFTSDPFPAQLLEAGLYGLELYRLRGDYLEILPLASLLATPSNVFLLSAPGYEFLRVLLPGPAWQTRQRGAEPHLAGIVDEIEVVDVGPLGEKPRYALLVRGWIVDLNNPNPVSSVAFQISGDSQHHVALAPVTRIDVAQAHKLSPTTKPGYEGAIWIGDLPPGTYSLEIVKCLITGVNIQRAAQLEIRPEGAYPCVKRFEVLSETLI